MLLRDVCDEEDALFILVAVCTEVAPSYFDRSISTPDLFLLGRLLEGCLPRLYAHIASLGASPEVLASPWLFSFFTNGSGFPGPTVLRLWDWFLLEGPDVLLLVLLALFRAAQDDLVLSGGLDECVAVLKARARAWHDAPHLVSLAQSELAQLGGDGALAAAREAMLKELQFSANAQWVKRQRKDVTVLLVGHFAAVTGASSGLASTLAELRRRVAEASFKEEVGLVFTGESHVEVAHELKYKFTRGRLRLLGQLPPLAVDAKRVRQIVVAQGLLETATAAGLFEASLRFYLVKEDADGHLVDVALFLAALIVLSPLDRAAKMAQVYALALAASGQAEHADLHVAIALLRSVVVSKLPELSDEDADDAVGSALQLWRQGQKMAAVPSSNDLAPNTIDDAADGGNFANFYLDGKMFLKEANKVKAALDLLGGETLARCDFEALVLGNSATRAVFGE
jgi:hypothetical protein